MSNDTHRTIDAVWRIESPRLIAGLARIVRDIGVAEDLAQDALVAALEQWPKSGLPDNPGAWLMAAAKHRAIDYFRRNLRLERKHEELARELASKACEMGRIDSNGVRAKPAREVRIGDMLRIKNEAADWEIEVLALSQQRGSASVAQMLYCETEAGIEARRKAAQKAKSKAEQAAPDLLTPTADSSVH